MEYSINIYVLLKYIVLALAMYGFFMLLHAILHAAKDTKLNIKTKTLDNEVIKELIKKFPDVSEEFMNKSEKLQNIENNQEIHEIKKQLRTIGEARKNG